MSKNFTDLVKDTYIDSRSPVKSNQDNPAPPTPNHTHIVIELVKTKGEEKLSWEQQSQSWGFTQDKWEHVYIKTYTHMFIAILLVIAKNWKELRCASASEWINEAVVQSAMDNYSAFIEPLIPP